MKNVILFFTVLIGLSCSKPENADPANKLVGTWQLINYCQPTTSAACAQVSVPTDKGVFITFTNDGTFNEYYQNTKPIEYGFLGCGSGDYTLEGDGVRIRALCMSSTQGRLMKIVSVDTKQLVLNPFDTGEYVFVKK
ncbi:lipocalin family protein [Spirosoma sp. BT702]|uniref:Lipocalin family protein n=1 Tax=Spirosoma profusum TaxID=2771354 RepID=A0A927APB7_9BACT|nr:lipocalin family protein [Spirosoma profusum]MBD2703844.1 lipocalin family protein [Spirosoma profusum]